MTPPPPPPPPTSDLVIRIALLMDDSTTEERELTPSVWRRFRCSSGINLDVFQDKILQPIMGWTRNYHTYYISTSNKKMHYFQSNSSAVDAFGMHDSYRAIGVRLDPTEYTIGDIVNKQGDTCYYGYDLGDHWYHKLTVERVISSSEDDDWNGKCQILDGAMRCPDEDGEGGANYQEEVLDLFNKKQMNPKNAKIARQYANACWNRVSAMNVGGVFEADDFSIQQTQAALQQALKSRRSERNGNKHISQPGLQDRSMVRVYPAKPGQRKLRYLRQDTRFDRGHPNPFVTVLEVINIKPDGESMALCTNCGSPHGLKKCSGCSTAWYCSRTCQKADWKSHKKQCKIDKHLHEEYMNELNGMATVPTRYQEGPKVLSKRFGNDDNNNNTVRFTEGTRVECLIGPGDDDDMYGTGTIIKALHEYDGKVHAYQVELDQKSADKMGIPSHMAPLIWADWDCDYQIRKI